MRKKEYKPTPEGGGERMKRDLIKLLFEKEFDKQELDIMYEYKGRIIADHIRITVKFIDFLDKIKYEYGIKGNEATQVIIEEFELEEWVDKWR